MNKKTTWLILSLFMILSVVLAACAPAATATEAPTSAPTQPPAPTAAPTQPPAPTAAPTTAPTAAPTTAPTAAPKPITIGEILVGPYNDTGWSQATYEGLQYVVTKLPGTKLVYVDNAFSHQGTTPAQLAEQLVSQGANVIVFNSDAFMDDSNTFAAAHPDVVVFMLSGDQNWADGQNYKNIPNMINIMGEMEYMKEIAGCTAALTTTTGKIGFSAASSEIARALQIQRGDVLLTFSALLFSTSGKVVDLSFSHFLPGYFHFHVVRNVTNPVVELREPKAEN